MANKRANGDGSFYFDEVKEIYRAMITTPAGKRLTKSSKDESIVKDWFNEQRLLVGRGQHIEPHSMTLGHWIDEWLEVYAKNNVRPRTYDRYISLLAHADSIRKIRLVTLGPSHFQKLYNGLTDLSGTTKKHIHFCLSGCLKQAVINKILYANPMKAVETPKATTKEIEIFTNGELDAIKKTAETDRYPLVIYIAINTGMRLSEILALEWDDIDFKKSTISVKRTVHYSTSAGVHTVEPKSESSKRIIKIDTAILLKLKEYKLSSKNKTNLFLTKQDNLLTPHTYLRWHYSPVRAAANITKGFHALRHTHATFLLAAGIPVVDVSKRLGHSRPSTTMNIYAHVIDTDENKIIDVVNNVFNKK